MLEEGRPRHAAVVGAHDACPGVGGELLAVPVPRGPARGVGIDQNQQIGGFHRRIVRPHGQGVQPVDAHQASGEPQRVQVAVLHPADREIEAAVGDAGRLSV
ncbi:hypothetical protein A5717_11870 [Mycolicibacterium porcinum]|nr:hypothetical protein A5717_11870 [Mycolicibacterium porcinum]